MLPFKEKVICYLHKIPIVCCGIYSLHGLEIWGINCAMDREEKGCLHPLSGFYFTWKVTKCY